MNCSASTHYRSGTIGAVMVMYRTRFLGHKFVSCGGPE